MTFRERTISHIGAFPSPVPLEWKIESEKKFDGYTGQVISYNIEENERVRSILLTPETSEKKNPAILAIHQHNGEYHLGKAEPAGWDINGKLKNLNPMYAYGRDLVKRGYIVICPDLLCFEERCDSHFINTQNPGSDHEIFEFTKRVQYGSSLLAKYLHDMTAAVNVLCEQENVDTSRLGVAGHSLGGQTSLYMTWYDQRLKAGVSSCGFGTLATIIRDKINHNKAMYIPGYSTYADTYDILCDIAPRAFAFTAGTDDLIFPIDGVREIAKKAEKIYTELGIPDKLLTCIFKGGHSFNNSEKEKVYKFLEKELMM